MPVGHLNEIELQSSKELMVSHKIQLVTHNLIAVIRDGVS